MQIFWYILAAICLVYELCKDIQSPKQAAKYIEPSLCPKCKRVGSIVHPTADTCLDCVIDIEMSLTAH